MPVNAMKNKVSAVFSSRVSFLMSSVLIEAKDKPQETARIKATKEENSSIRLLCDCFETWSDVMTIKQNPSRLAAVFRICCDVLLGIEKLVMNCDPKFITTAMLFG